MLVPWLGRLYVQSAQAGTLDQTAPLLSLQLYLFSASVILKSVLHLFVHSRWVWAFLVSFLLTMTSFLYSFQVAWPCFYLLYISCLCSSNNRSSLFIQIWLLVLFLMPSWTTVQKKGVSQPLLIKLHRAVYSKKFYSETKITSFSLYSWKSWFFLSGLTVRFVFCQLSGLGYPWEITS